MQLGEQGPTVHEPVAIEGGGEARVRPGGLAEGGAHLGRLVGGQWAVGSGQGAGGRGQGAGGRGQGEGGGGQWAVGNTSSGGARLRLQQWAPP